MPLVADSCWPKDSVRIFATGRDTWVDTCKVQRLCRGGMHVASDRGSVVMQIRYWALTRSSVIHASGSHYPIDAIYVFSSRHTSKPIYPTPVVNPRTPAVTSRSNKAVYVTKAIWLIPEPYYNNSNHCYYMAPFPMTLNDLKVILAIVNFFKCDFSVLMTPLTSCRCRWQTICLQELFFFSVTPPPVGQQSIVMSVSVCLQAYLRYHNPFFMNFCASFLHDRGLVLSWRRCDTLCSLLPVLWMTSYLHIMGHMEACRYRCSELRHYVVVRRLTSLLRRLDCVVSPKTAGRPVYCARGAGGGPCSAPWSCCLCGRVIVAMSSRSDRQWKQYKRAMSFWSPKWLIMRLEGH